MFDKKTIKVILTNILISFIIPSIIFISADVFDWDIPIGIVSVLGIFGGPYGAIGIAIATFLGYLDFDIFYAILEALLIFLISYFAYKVWYSFTEKSGFIYLDSIFNFLKLILVLSLSSIVFYHLDLFSILIINFIENSFMYMLQNSFIVVILNFFVLTLIIVSIILVILSYFNKSFYYPGKINIDLLDSFYNKYDNIKLINYLKYNPKIFDYSLICIIVLSLVLSVFPLLNITLSFNIHIICLSILILLVIFYLFKPLNKDISKNSAENNIINKSKGFNSFSLTEVLIMLFVVMLLCLVVCLFILYVFDFLNPIPNFSRIYSFLIYVSFILLFLVPFIVVLWYVEKRVSRPLNRMSEVLSDYFKDGNISKEARDDLQNMSKFLNHESEVGILANVLSQMSLDLDEYIENIQNLTAVTERINAELAIAHDIQDSFLPKNFDLDENDLNISAVMIPAKAVGGDFYDFFMVDDDHFAFVIADVSDKGVPAALFMVKSKQIIQSSILSYHLGNEDYSLEEIIYEINNDLCVNNDSCMFVTSWIGLIDLNNGELTFVNAGHESPIIKSDGEFKFLETENDLVLGVMEDMEFNSHVIDLHSGDKILLYTDGVTDANNENKEFFGNDNLLKVVKENDFNVNDSINGIIDSVNDFTQNQEQFDDFTMLLVEYNPKR